MKSKILTAILAILTIVLIVVYIKLPAQREKTKTVSKDEYKNMIYDKVYEMYGKKEQEEKEYEEEIEIPQDELYKMK